MASVHQKFVLVGPHAGQTMHVNGHEFVDGEMAFQGSAEQAATLERVFEFYGAMTAEKAELHALRGKQKPADSKQPEGGAWVDSGTSGGQADAQGSATSTEAAKPAQDAPNGAPDAKPSLAEAIGLLDPEVDAHWTSNNLPNLERLGELTGKKVARDEVNAVAEGYTRAKARAAKQ